MSVKGRLTQLERAAPAAAKARVRVPSELAGWWRAHLDKSLTTAQAVALAEAVIALDEGRQVTAEQELSAEVAWGQVWAAGDELDQRRLVRAFGARGGWRQVLNSS